MRTILLLLLLTYAVCTHAQKEGYVWAYGEKNGIDFNVGSPVGIVTGMEGGTVQEGVASICDASGQLLFYSEGSDIWDRNGSMMPNGSNLTGLSDPTGNLTATSSCTQGAVIVPMPDSAGKYYIFSLTSSTGGTNSMGYLFYSIVDMSLNSSLGDVVPGRKGILIDTGFTEKMTAVVGDRCNVWLILRTYRPLQQFKAYNITQGGIDLNPVISASGITFAGTPGLGAGVIKASHDRKKIVACHQYNGIEIFDFDAASGVLSNPQTLHQFQAYYGAAFSPDNTKLYYTNAGDRLYQFDLSLPSIAAIASSRTVIGNNMSFTTDLKAGPDGKIYFLNDGGLGTINFPNLAGSACQYSPLTIPLVSNSGAIGLPNDLAIFRRDTMSANYAVDVCFRDSLELKADTSASGWDHIWNGGQATSNLMVDSSGVYVVTFMTPPCTFHIDTFKIRFMSPSLQYGVFNGCNGTGNNYLWIKPGANDTNLYTYTWRNAAGQVLQTHTRDYADTLFVSSPGDYTVNVFDGLCDTQIVLTILPPNYDASFTSDSFLCIGATATFVNLSHGFSTYTWYFGDGFSSTDNNPDHVYDAPGTYLVTLIGYPCADSFTRPITIDSMSYINFLTGNDRLCEGQGISFYPSYPEGADTIFWDFGDQTIVRESFQPVHAYDSAGTWVVTVTASFRACPDATFYDSILVYPYPDVDLGDDTSICVNGAPVLLQNLGKNKLGYTYQWNSGDSSSTVLARHHGIYALTVTNENGCSTTDSVEIFKGCYLNIPNAFTPNGDGANDYFFPRHLLSERLTAFKMQIFNRWGQLIFITDKLEGRGWDGRFNERDQPQGVYIYLIDAEIDGQNREHYKGNITLLR